MKIIDIIEKRKNFNKAFNLPISDKPTLIGVDRVLLQFNMMKEELEEYYDAGMGFDRVLTADALIDMQEILLGMFAEHGMLDLIPELYNEVHDSNMSKLDDNGKPLINGENGVYDTTRPMGKVIKSKNFKEPNFAKILNK